MKALGILVVIASGSLIVACGGDDHRIGGSNSPIGQTGGSGGSSGDETGGSSGEGSGGVATGGVGGGMAVGGGPATGGVGGGVATGGVGGGMAVGGGPATGGVGGGLSTGGVGGGVATGGVGGGPANQCTSDADCRLVSFMCTGCDCLVLGPLDQDPTCPGQGVQCFADPCMNNAAVCSGGSCVAADDGCAAGETRRNICVSCGTAGGCSQTADVCTKTCTQSSDCTGQYNWCVQGVCQVGGCI